MTGALAMLAALAGAAWLWWVCDRMTVAGVGTLLAYGVGAMAGAAIGAWAWLPVVSVVMLFVTARHFWPAKEEE